MNEKYVLIALRVDQDLNDAIEIGMKENGYTEKVPYIRMIVRKSLSV